MTEEPEEEKSTEAQLAELRQAVGRPALVYQEHLAKALKAAAQRRDKILDCIERQRASLGEDLCRLSDQIIAAEFAVPAAQAEPVAALDNPSSPAVAMVSESKLATRTISQSRSAGHMRLRRRIAVRSISQRRIAASRSNGRKS